jgi:predicted nucleotidyltransferase
VNEYTAADVLLGRGRTRRRILELLIDRPKRRLHLRAIARAVGASAGTTSRELRRLEQAGLVLRSREGAQVYFQAAVGSPLLEPVAALLHASTTSAGSDPIGLAIARQMATRLPSVYGDRLRGVFLYGSRARGDHRADSDVDILIVLARIGDYGADLRRSSGLASELSLEHGVTVSRLIIPERDWEARDRPIVRSAARDAIAA